ncbi:MAG TPA: HD-GYP domain-containing protein [Thermomicrobiales bacterium]|nr:HD-GYP domain-containing protein [Thermomicrobiales bacterium]
MILTAAAAILAGSGISGERWVPPTDWWVAASLLLVLIVIERLDVSIPFGSETLRASVGAPLALASAMYLGVGLGCLIVFTAHVADSILARRDPLKSLTNIATFVTATAVGGWIYVLFADLSISPVSDARNLTVALVASLAFVFVNTLCMSSIVGPILGMPVIDLWRSTTRLAAVEAVTLPAIAGLVALAADESAIAVLLLAFPLLGPQVAYRTLARAQRSTRDTLETLVDAVEQRDPYTAYHSSRVAGYARQILAEMSDIPYQLTETIVTAARLHDIGKVGVRDVTLYKPGPLTPDERMEVLRHADLGAAIVSRTEEYRMTASIIRHHHERWDGSGYPDRISGEDIPLGARVIAVADAFDAMTTDRPYSTAMSDEVAIREITRGAGTHFDPVVVNAFLRSVGAERLPSAPDAILHPVPAR